MMIDLDNSTKYMHAVITSPVPNPDKPFKYPAAFPGKIEFEADLYNSRDVHDIGIEVSMMGPCNKINAKATGFIGGASRSIFKDILAYP